jgi:hypothetical protein
MVKNEELMLKEILPIWEEYPIDKFVFYDDLSTDDTVNLIKDFLGQRAVVITNKSQTTFNESHNRSAMLEYSRKEGASHVVCIDADELMSQSLLNDFDKVIGHNSQYDIQYYWYNVVNGGIDQYRQDPMYINNYRTFILPLKNTGYFDMSQWKYHTPRTPFVNLPKRTTKDYGFIHLQSINKRFYALKQLWYKHYEQINYGHSVDFINSRYDPVVNKLNFCEKRTPDFIKGDIELSDSFIKVFDKIEEIKCYKEYILDNLNQELVTFGSEFLE